MAVSQSNLLSLNLDRAHFSRTSNLAAYTFIPSAKVSTCTNKPQFSFSYERYDKTKYNCNRFKLPASTILNEHTVPVEEKEEGEYGFSGWKNIFRKRVELIGSILTGGNWWSLCDNQEEEGVKVAKPITALNALRRIWSFVADKKWIVSIAIGSLIVASISEISMPGMLAASIFSAQRGETEGFVRNMKLLAFLCATSGICSGIRSCCFGILNVILVKRLREALFSTFLFMDISFYDREEVGGLTSRLTADCQQLSHLIEYDIHLILRNSLQGTGAMINLLSLSWPLALSALVICSAIGAIFLVYGSYQRKTGKMIQECTACANEAAQETLAMMKTVRVYGTEWKEVDRYKHWLEKLCFVVTRQSVAHGFWSLSFHNLYRATQIFAVLLGGFSFLSIRISPEQLTKYVMYCEWLIYAAWRMADNFSSLLQSIGATEKVFEFLDCSQMDQFLFKGAKLQRLMGQIQFVNVSFYYPTRIEVPVLEHINFSIQPNEVVAIVGLSGSGKSTLVNLLLRLYEPIDGQILIDGIPLKELDIGWLRQNIGYVGQEPPLFHMDIKSNIKYGCSRDIKQEDIESAAKQAYAHEFIQNLPHGYETLVDSNKLSGGQKQRIAIARAILREPVILILDEATSALDSETEDHVKDAIYTLKKGCKTRTIIVIAHRLSIIEASDRIIVLEGGRIMEVGNHRQLLLNDGLYAKLNNIQRDVLT